MSHSLYRCIACAAMLAVLAGCGGGGGGSSVDPLSSSGFATARESISKGDTFTVPSVARARTLSSSVSTLQTETINISILDGSDTVRLTLSEGTFDLVRNASGAFLYEDATRRVILQRVLLSSDQVETVYIGYTDDNAPTSGGFVTFGFDTNPATIAAETGSATYRGDIAWLVDGTSRFGFGDGTFALDVNFDDLKVSGIFTLIDDADPGGGLTIPTTNFITPEISIDGNGFTGTVGGGFAGGAFTDVQIEQSEVTGRFHGPDAEALGGLIAIDLVDANGNPAFAIQGGFAGGRN